MSSRFDRSPAGKLRVGDRAPFFELRRTFEESVSLDELRVDGPVLLLFYVFDFGDV